MKDGDDQSLWRRMGSKGLAIGGVALAFIAFKVVPIAFGAAVGHEAVSLVRQHNDASSVDKAIENLTNDPQLGATYRIMEREFPSDYATLKAQLKEIVLTSQTEQDAATRSMALTQKWVGERRSYLRSADDAAVAKLMEDQEATLRHLQVTDVAECAFFGMEGKMRSPHKGDAVLVDLAAQNFSDTIVALKSGMMNKSQPVSTLSDADGDALVRQVHQLHPREDLEQLVLSGKIGSAGAADQCRGSLLTVQAINGLPQPQRGRVSRYMLDPSST